mmetsp:Transcript_33743/g.55553  ORF Transcript_33743/g.55553 Transcript_33743/m.55553 type:complete len:237 (-) Transcript_33743:151-861(-)
MIPNLREWLAYAKTGRCRGASTGALLTHEPLGEEHFGFHRVPAAPGTLHSDPPLHERSFLNILLARLRNFSCSSAERHFLVNIEEEVAWPNFYPLRVWRENEDAISLYHRLELRQPKLSPLWIFHAGQECLARRTGGDHVLDWVLQHLPWILERAGHEPQLEPATRHGHLSSKEKVIFPNPLHLRSTRYHLLLAAKAQKVEMTRECCCLRTLEQDGHVDTVCRELLLVIRDKFGNR